AGGTLNLTNTIVANTLVGAAAAPDLIVNAGSIGTVQNNLIEQTTAVTGGGTNANIVGQDPKLVPLASQGGLTFTYELQSNSPAIDAGRTQATLFTDQRGLPRVFDYTAIANGTGGAGIDIGAVEHRDGAVRYVGFQPLGSVLPGDDNSAGPA